MKKIPVLIIVLALLVSLNACTKKKTPTSPVAPTPDINGYYTASSSNIDFKWKVNGTNLDIKVSAPTTGWVGVGFGSDGTMANAQDFIMGYVTSSNVITISDMHTVGHSAPAADSVDHITNAVGTEASGTTELDFTIPLNSGSGQDMVLSQNMSVWVLLAYGSNGQDNFTTQHAVYTAVQITLY